MALKVRARPMFQKARAQESVARLRPAGQTITHAHQEHPMNIQATEPTSALEDAHTPTETAPEHSAGPRAPRRSHAARTSGEPGTALAPTTTVITATATDQRPSGRGRRPAMNALKLGIFSSSSMPWEDPAAREKIVRPLREEWQVGTATAELLVQHLASCTMQLARISHAISSLSSNCFSDWQYRHAYLKSVSRLIGVDRPPPEWAYSDELEPRKRSKKLFQVERQLLLLRDHPTAERKLYAHRHLPDLWEHLTGSVALSPHSKDVMDYIAQHVSTDSPEQDVQQYLQDFQQKHWFSLIYARHGEQLDAGRDYVRSTATLDLHSREHWQKASARLHAQVERIHLQLLAMRRQRLEAGAQPAILAPASSS